MSGPTKKAGVMGWPVEHSLSPRIHGYWLKQYGIDGSYGLIAVQPAVFAVMVRSLAQEGYAGANVTLPHKEAALKIADTADPTARRIGAANTLVVDEDGRVHAFNTDAYGFLEHLRSAAPGWRAAAGPAVVLGAGGASRAVVSALLDAGLRELRLLNRSRDRADVLANDFGGVQVLDWADRARALEGAALLVNTTTLGMVGQAPLDLDLARLPATAVVDDIVYRPLQTPLLKAAAARGNPTVDGLGMLLHQARPGFRAWFGVEPEVTPALRRCVLEGLGEEA
jgi:shikimate dehydrogenase